MHEVIALKRRATERAGRPAPVPFELSRIRASRFAAVDKAPSKTFELRMKRPIARQESERLRPIAERTGIVEKLAHRVVRAGKLRLFRLWKIFGDDADDATPVIPRPLAERLAWLRRTRRL